jgi:hypothetical protein
MIQRRHAYCMLAAALAFTQLSSGAADAQRNDGKKPSLSLKATPPLGFSPLRVRLMVEVRGGDEDPELYCPSIEWDWGDDQTSQSSEDCAPYQAGKSTIRRRYSTEHVFRESGTYTVRFRMKQGNRVVASASANVQVRDGHDDLDR